MQGSDLRCRICDGRPIDLDPKLVLNDSLKEHNGFVGSTETFFTFMCGLGHRNCIKGAVERNCITWSYLKAFVD